MNAAFWSIARRPRWIAALFLAFGIAAAFAALGQWQLERSFQNAGVQGANSEQAVPLDTIAQPSSSATDLQLGQRVTTSGVLVSGDFVVLSDRDNDNGGPRGSWLVGHLRTPDGASLPVALGWAPDSAAARAAQPAALAELETRAATGEALVGRYLPSESPIQSNIETGDDSALAVADLVNRWADAQPIYGGYLVLDQPVGDLEAIHSPVPDREVSLNLLNVFYAAEWVIFALLAFYLWYRLVKDEVEKEEELAADSGVTAAEPAAEARP